MTEIVHQDRASSVQSIERIEFIMEELKKRKYRLTYQRKLMLEMLLNNTCSSCKEIHEKVKELDPNIGIATVYRMVKLLEDLEILDQRRLYRIAGGSSPKHREAEIILTDGMTKHEINKGTWFAELKQEIKDKGYTDRHRISVIIQISTIE